MRKLRPQSRDNSAGPRGQQTALAILTAARDVLVEEGHPRLTMRNIAARAGMTVGNLSYYYANKQDLLHDLIDAVIQGYVEEFDRISEDSGRTGEERLEELMRFVIGDLSTPETTAFFPALWALSIHDEFAAREMNDMYEIERAVFLRLITEMRPDLGKRECEWLALFITASIEGHTVFIGHRRAKRAAAGAIANIAVASVLALVRTITAEEINGAPDRAAKMGNSRSRSNSRANSGA
jgi:AcrR family transcriptional regulator